MGARCTASCARIEARRVAGNGERTEQVRVKHRASLMLSRRKSPEPTDHQEILLDCWLLLDVGQPFGGFEHCRASGVARVVTGDLCTIRGQRLDLRHDVE